MNYNQNEKLELMSKNMIEMISIIKLFDEKYLAMNSETEYWKNKFYQIQENKENI